MKVFLTAFSLALITSSLFPVTALAQQPASIAGKTDLLGAAPGMSTGPQEAVTRSYDEVYAPFYKRVEAAHTTLQNAMAWRYNAMPHDQATLEKQARSQANSNAIVAGMGGIDSIQQMTPQQREAAAHQSVANFQQNLVTAGGRKFSRDASDDAKGHE
jgi:hypothetical protein